MMSGSFQGDHPWSQLLQQQQPTIQQLLQHLQAQQAQQAQQLLQHQAQQAQQAQPAQQLLQHLQQQHAQVGALPELNQQAQIGASPEAAPAGLVHRLRALERGHARDAWRKLDERIPLRFKTKARRNAGSRALGAQGRSAADILNDCIACVKEIRASTARGSAAVAAHRAGTGALAADTLSEGLLSARDLFCVEVRNLEPLHRLASRRWIICRVGKGAGKSLVLVYTLDWGHIRTHSSLRLVGMMRWT